jgi:pimeloyl-ACP methyl ester carboxylesterase
VSVLEVDGLTLSYEVYGAGPAIGIPWCNFAWHALDLGLLTAAYTVVVASPRGFGNSERVGSGYDASTICTDLEAVLDHVGIEQYVAFGYSMTGSVAPWLAHDNPRVRAVVSGGFPTASSYGGVLPYITANLAETQQDPVRWAEMSRKFDPDALLAWYRHLDSLRPGELVERLDCPIYCFWGGADEVIEELVGLKALVTDTASRDIPFLVHAGRDHEGMLLDIDVAARTLLPWLRDVWPPR